MQSKQVQLGNRKYENRIEAKVENTWSWALITKAIFQKVTLF